MKRALGRYCVFILPLAGLLLSSCAAPGVSYEPAAGTSKLSPANEIFDLEAEGLKTLWRANLGQVAGRRIEKLYCTGPLVVVEATDGEIHCFDAESGIWQTYAVFHRGLVRAPVQMGETLFVVVADRLYGLNIRTGRRSTGFNPKFAVSVPPVVYEDSLILAGANGHLACLPILGTQLSWTRSLSGPILEPPVLSGDRLFASAHGDKVMAVEPDSGYPVWTWQPKEPSQISSGLAADGDYVYVGDNRGYVYALQDAVGAPQGKRMVHSAVTSQPWIVGEQLLVLTAKPSLISLVPGADMARLWAYDGAARVLSASRSVVYVQTADGSVAAVSLETGDELWRHGLPEGCRVEGDPFRPVFYVANEQGNIVAFAELD